MINNDYYQDFPQAWSQETQEAWAPTQAGPAVLDYPLSMTYGEDFIAAAPLTVSVYEDGPDIPHDRGPGLSRGNQGKNRGENMSTFENKVTVATDFLRNRASLNRRTTLQELGTVMGEVLNKRGQRSIATPVSRDKLRKVLREVDKQSWAEDGILLSALVVHFWDNKPGRHFFESAEALTGFAASGSPEKSEYFHNKELRKACARYTELVPVITEPVIPDDISELDDEDEDADIF